MREQIIHKLQMNQNFYVIQKSENNNPEREEYSLLNNNCGTFAIDVLNQDTNVKKDAPKIVDPCPVSIVEEEDVNVVSESLPSDPQDPSRKNNITPKERNMNNENTSIWSNFINWINNILEQQYEIIFINLYNIISQLQL